MRLKNITNKKVKKSRVQYFYPILLIAFTLTFLYFFIFGENGYYAHKKKLNYLYNLENINKKLYSSISYYKNKLKSIKETNINTLEEEARQIPLKKRGEYIIKLYNKKWIEQLSLAYEKKMEKKVNTSKELNSFAFKYKVISVLSISLLLAFTITFIQYPKVLYKKYKN